MLVGDRAYNYRGIKIKIIPSFIRAYCNVANSFYFPYSFFIGLYGEMQKKFNPLAYFDGCRIMVSSFLGSTAQLRPWPPPQNPAEFLGGFATIFFLQGSVVSPTPNPHPGGPGLCIYTPQRQGGYPF
jgi:hypothetical protein